MQHSGQDEALRLMIQGNKQSNSLRGIVWEQGQGAKVPMESLDRLISNGAFKPINAAYATRNKSRIRIKRFGTREKRELAVKLGHSLMDFFDTSFGSGNIYFAVAEGDYVHVSLPYLGFTTDIPTSTKLREFQMGHPILLAFAKLLMEIDDGDKLRHKISSSYDDGINQKTWTRLLVAADKMEVEKSGPYLEAVRGCLMVYRNIAQSLRHSESSGKEADLEIREQIYVHVVEKLERTLEQSKSRSSSKRKNRELSPPRQEHAVIERPYVEYSTASSNIGQNRPSLLQPDLGMTSPRKRPRMSSWSEPITIREDNRINLQAELQHTQNLDRTIAGFFHDDILSNYTNDVYVCFFHTVQYLYCCCFKEGFISVLALIAFSTVAHPQISS